jgi:hypothetical protein
MDTAAEKNRKKEMAMRRLLTLTAALFMVLNSSPVMAEDDIERLEKKIEVLTEEVEVLKEEREEGGPEFLDRLTIGGYGELHFNDFDNKDSEIDFHRFVLFFAYDFNDWIKFASELEVEHVIASQGDEGEVELEQAFLDFLLSRPVNLRAGLMLVPVGIINETHEPPTFYGVERPDVDKNIIPTTWWEAGVGIFGEVLPGINYKLYFVSSLDASGFKASSGLRSGRQKVSEAKAEDFALTGRLEYTGLPGLNLGGSFFRGDTGQNDPALGDATVTLWEADARYSIQNFDFRGLYAYIDVDDADKIFAETGQVVGETIVGWYVEGAYRFLNHILPGTEQDLAVFARYSEYDTQHKVPSGLTSDGANDIEVFTVGLDYKPHPSVVIKLDYQDRDNDSSTIEATDQWNVGIGYWF